MPPKHVAARPRVLVLSNDNVNWPASDREWTDRMLAHLSTALTSLGYAHEVRKVDADLDLLALYDPREWVIWNWVEELGGRPWTDAEAARAYERRGFAFTGAGSPALSTSVDRLRIKRALVRSGLPTLPGLRLRDPRQVARWKHYPAIVKGATQHGSYGIDRSAVVHTPAELARRVEWLRESLGCDAQVERFLDGREFHIGAVARVDGQLEGLPAAEIDYTAFDRLEDRLYAYGYKHDEDDFGYHALKVSIPAAIPTRLDRRLRQLAADALVCLGARDYGRIDVRLDGDRPMILDVNINCDLDATSVVMRTAALRGLSYAQVVGRILAATTQRMPGQLGRRMIAGVHCRTRTAQAGGDTRVSLRLPADDTGGGG
ncbi:MAG TPA: hypothetical protein PLC98_00690 [Anaerolineales bacterium]|nr:hypothetical protein [Anaerolineales bacterium]